MFLPVISAKTQNPTSTKTRIKTTLEALRLSAFSASQNPTSTKTRIKTYMGTYQRVPLVSQNPTSTKTRIKTITGSFVELM